MRIRSLHSLLIVLLVLASLPAWTVQSQAGHGRTLACVHACALSDSVMTDHGRLPGLGNGQCSVRSQARAAALVPVPIKVMVPAGGISAPGSVATGLPLASGFNAASPRRGPPAYGGFLWSQHPSAQAPPTLL